jgi:hypothetical protein
VKTPMAADATPIAAVKRCKVFVLDAGSAPNTARIPYTPAVIGVPLSAAIGVYRFAFPNAKAAR